MRILLVGEYSRLHNSLKEGLQKLGHEVRIIGSGDSFKKFPVDFPLDKKYQHGLSKKLKVGIYKLSQKDIGSKNILKQFLTYSEKLKGYDIVQLINESPLGIQPQDERKAIAFLKEHNDRIFLLSCGTDYSNVSYAMEGKIRYSIFTPLLEGKVSKDQYAAALKYLQPNFKKLHHYLYDEVIDGVIASDMDYHFALKRKPQYKGLMPNPVNMDKLPFETLDVSSKIVLFLGINHANYTHKGIGYFEKALLILKEKYADRIEILRAENLPYQTYIQQYKRAHILLDQIFSFDQGYNALEAMAQGKVVFTGAEPEVLDFYGISADEVCINALPDVDDLVEKLSELIDNPQKIIQMGQQARRFIEEKHDYRKIAQQYLKIWTDGKA